LNLVTDRTYSCADFVIPALDYYELLPDTGQSGQHRRGPGLAFFTCSMGMYTGQIV
jgi:hypothetical protein